MPTLPAAFPPALLAAIARRPNPQPDAAGRVAAFWKLLQLLEQETKEALATPVPPPDKSCEGGYVLHDLNTGSAGTPLEPWLRALGMPPTTLGPRPTLPGDGVLLADGNLLNNHPFSMLDPCWASAALGYLLLLVDPRLKAAFPTTPVRRSLPPSDTLTLALAGDWGTGPWDDEGQPSPAEQVGAQIRACAADLTVHLGDVYPLGLGDYERARLADTWPQGRHGAFTLNSNHEMYAWGRGYYEVALRHPTFAAQQGTGYFSLEWGPWLVLGLDTGYYDPSLIFSHGSLATDADGNPDPREPQNQFLQQAGHHARATGKAVLLLTHHHGLSLDGTQRTSLWDQVTTLLGQPPDVWCWGHNHKGIVYTADSAADPRTAARCLGHASLPFGEATKLRQPDGTPLPSIRYFTCTPLGGSHQHRVRNGFLRLTLRADGWEEAWIDQGGDCGFAAHHPLPTPSA